ncbi:cytochrome c-type biogenesis protein CcmE [Salmonella enterica subsp. arizonae]|uniref:Cytochrome c-type biogenesis protein CcmE n=1 Tax=Salmonella enterica subsp. arizonae TaxID=59203 RepID=A0A379T2W1_SALER|nr:cytochrome c-type biogenesis protein CcmE [Salmonella enterica subsp. arizonae]
MTVILPDLFREGQGVVVQGSWTGEIMCRPKRCWLSMMKTTPPPEVEKAMQENHRRPQSGYKDKSS